MLNENIEKLKFIAESKKTVYTNIESIRDISYNVKLIHSNIESIKNLLNIGFDRYNIFLEKLTSFFIEASTNSNYLAVAKKEAYKYSLLNEVYLNLLRKNRSFDNDLESLLHIVMASLHLQNEEWMFDLNSFMYDKNIDEDIRKNILEIIIEILVGINIRIKYPKIRKYSMSLI